MVVQIAFLGVLTQTLKPERSFVACSGTTEVVPFRTTEVMPFRTTEVVPFRASEVMPFRTSEVVPFRATKSCPFALLREENREPAVSKGVKVKETFAGRSRGGGTVRWFGGLKRSEVGLGGMLGSEQPRFEARD